MKKTLLVTTLAFSVIQTACTSHSKASGLAMSGKSNLVVANAGSQASTGAPNDTFFDRQWALHNTGAQTTVVNMDDLHTKALSGRAGADIGWLEAQPLVQRSATNPVVVAVIDFGADETHPDLQGRFAEVGYDFINDLPLAGDPNGHGTHVSGLIAANANNKTGITGITPASVKILPLNVLSSDFTNFILPSSGKTLSDYVTLAVNYAVAHNAKIINMSLGWPKIIDSDASRKAINDAIQKGVLIVVSAGNDRKEHPTYPCSQDGVLCVGALSNTGAMSFYSNFGGAVDVLAPGDDIISTYPTTLDSENLGIQGYELLTGTSQAAPQVTGIAAILKSINPNATPQELMARIMLSANVPPTENSAQYGLVNLSRAIQVTPQPAYTPNFKTVEDQVTLDEKTLTAHGTISLRNLWANASNVHVTVTANNQPAGSLTLAALQGQGHVVSIPWSYRFRSLDESAIVHVTLKVSDSQNGTPRAFSSNVTVSRSATAIASQKVMPFAPSIQAADLMGLNVIKKSYSKLLSVGLAGDTPYPQNSGAPYYYKTAVAADKSVSAQIFNANDLTKSSVVTVPFVSSVAHIIRVDLKNSGELDWCFLGTGHTAAGATYLQFYFTDSQFKPLFGSASAWQVSPEDSAQATALLKNYEDLNSWVRSDTGLLLPTFVAQTTLPKLDNFNSLDARSSTVQKHAFYMSPPANWQQTAAGAPVALEIHAVDNKDFAIANEKVFLVNMLPQTPQELKAGHLRAIMADATDLSATMYLYDIQDTKHATLTALPNWDFFSAVGTPFTSQPGLGQGVSMVYLKYYDEKDGGRSWTTSWSEKQQQLQPLSEFSYVADGYPDPVKSMIGAYNSPTLGQLALLDSDFNIVAKGVTAQGKAISSTFPLERETSNITESQMHELFNPILVGSTAQPIPAVFIDSTSLRGNLVSVVTWNAQTQQLQKTLRYSLAIPQNCLNLSPAYTTAGDLGSFAIPLLCQQGPQAFMRVIQPAH